MKELLAALAVVIALAWVFISPVGAADTFGHAVHQVHVAASTAGKHLFPHKTFPAVVPGPRVPDWVPVTPEK